MFSEEIILLCQRQKNVFVHVRIFPWILLIVLINKCSNIA